MQERSYRPSTTPQSHTQMQTQHIPHQNTTSVQSHTPNTTPACTQTPDASMHWQVSGCPCRQTSVKGAEINWHLYKFCSVTLNTHAHTHTLHRHPLQTRGSAHQVALKRHSHHVCVSRHNISHTDPSLCPLESAKQCRSLKLHDSSRSDTVSLSMILCLALSIQNPTRHSAPQSLLLMFK